MRWSGKYLFSASGQTTAVSPTSIDTPLWLQQFPSQRLSALRCPCQRVTLHTCVLVLKTYVASEGCLLALHSTEQSSTCSIHTYVKYSQQNIAAAQTCILLIFTQVAASKGFVSSKSDILPRPSTSQNTPTHI